MNKCKNVTLEEIKRETECVEKHLYIGVDIIVTVGGDIYLKMSKTIYIKIPTILVANKYPIVNIYGNVYYVSRLVLTAFSDGMKIYEKKLGYKIEYVDGNRENISLENLRWRKIHIKVLKRKENPEREKRIWDAIEMRMKGNSIFDVAEKMDFSTSFVSNIWAPYTNMDIKKVKQMVDFAKRGKKLPSEKMHNNTDNVIKQNNEPISTVSYIKKKDSAPVSFLFWAKDNIKKDVRINTLETKEIFCRRYPSVPVKSSYQFNRWVSDYAKAKGFSVTRGGQANGCFFIS